MGHRDAPRSCENPNGQLSVLGKEGPALVSDVPQDCQSTALLLEVLIPTSLITSPSSIANIRIMKMLESLDSVAF